MSVEAVSAPLLQNGSILQHHETIHACFTVKSPLNGSNRLSLSSLTVPLRLKPQSYDVPAVLGKTYEETVAIFGPPTSTLIPDKEEDVSMYAYWGARDKEHLIVVFYSPLDTVRYISWGTGTGAPRVAGAVLIKRLKLDSNDARYTITMYPKDSPETRYFRVRVYLKASP